MRKALSLLHKPFSKAVNNKEKIRKFNVKFLKKHFSTFEKYKKLKENAIKIKFCENAIKIRFCFGFSIGTLCGMSIFPLIVFFDIIKK